jgi:hypothetical protein
MRRTRDLEDDLASRFALALLALAAPATLVASCAASPVSPWIVGLGGATIPVALIALGVARGGRLGSLRLPLILLWLVLAGGLVTLLALPDGGPDFGPLPVGTMILLFVLVPVPLAIVGVAYAGTFGRWFLRDEDLDRIRRIAERKREG